MPHILTEHEKKANNVSSYEELVEREMAKIARHHGKCGGRVRSLHPSRKTGIIKIICHCHFFQEFQPEPEPKPVMKEPTKKTEPLMKEPTKKTEPVKKEANIAHEQLDLIIKQIKSELSQGFADISSQIEASTDYISTLQRK